MISVVIPARGGSTRIPRKNLIKVGGQTLLQRSIEIGLKMSDDVVVSSDDDEILREATIGGVRSLKRPASLANDYVHAYTAVQHAMWNCEYDHIVMLDCSTLFDVDPVYRYISYVKQKLRNFPESVFSAFAVTKFSGFIYDHNGEPINRAVHERPRTQDMRQYKESGGFYLFKRTAPPMDQVSIGAKMVCVEWSHSIDTTEDLEEAYRLAERYNL